MADWTAADLPSFAGRTAIVTGANGGLGEVTARELARVGAHVILAVRDPGKGEAAGRRPLRNPIRCFDQVLATAAAFRFLRQPSRPNAPRPLAKSGSAAGTGVSICPSPLVEAGPFRTRNVPDM